MTNIEKLESSISESKIKCSCGHTFPALPTTKIATCSYCGKKHRNDSLTRFRYMFYKEREKKCKQ